MEVLRSSSSKFNLEPTINPSVALLFQSNYSNNLSSYIKMMCLLRVLTKLFVRHWVLLNRLLFRFPLPYLLLVGSSVVRDGAKPYATQTKQWQTTSKCFASRRRAFWLLHVIWSGPVVRWLGRVSAFVCPLWMSSSMHFRRFEVHGGSPRGHSKTTSNLEMSTFGFHGAGTKPRDRFVFNFGIHFGIHFGNRSRWDNIL